MENILDIIVLGNPILRKEAMPISKKELASSRFQGFIDSLIATMRVKDGVGLAANQVACLKQIFVIEMSVDNERYEDREKFDLMILINPIITPLSKKKSFDHEGCLSLPGLRGLVPRYEKISIQSLDRTGKPQNFIAEGFKARVIQHENDHLKGKVFIDRMDDFESLGYISELSKEM